MTPGQVLLLALVAGQVEPDGVTLVTAQVTREAAVIQAETVNEAAFTQLREPPPTAGSLGMSS